MQNTPSLADRPNISDALTVTLRNLIVDGQLPAGDRVNEVHLAARLGVSRTPLREALGRLVAEGAIATAPRIGFSVRPLTLDEFEQVYAVRTLLDPEALRLAGVPSPQALGRLRSLNRAIREARDADKVIDLDDAWHLELVAACPNRLLVGLIEQFMRRTRRYELALMKERPDVRVSVGHHAKITAALSAGDLKGACNWLRRNLQHGKAPIVAWLKERQTKPAPPERRSR
jgi:DNA-binding GntR family transcriptional regulator